MQVLFRTTSLVWYDSGAPGTSIGSRVDKRGEVRYGAKTLAMLSFPYPPLNLAFEFFTANRCDNDDDDRGNDGWNPNRAEKDRQKPDIRICTTVALVPNNRRKGRAGILYDTNKPQP